MNLRHFLAAAMCALLPVSASANLFETYYEVRCLPEAGVMEVKSTVFRGRAAVDVRDTPDALAKLEEKGIYQRASSGTCTIQGRQVEWKVDFAPSDCKTGKSAAVDLTLSMDKQDIFKQLPIGYYPRSDAKGVAQIDRLVLIPNYDMGIPELWIYGYWKGAVGAPTAAPLGKAWLDTALTSCQPSETGGCNYNSGNIWNLIETSWCTGDNRKQNAERCAQADLRDAEAEITRFFHEKAAHIPQAERSTIISNHKLWENKRDETCKRSKDAKPSLKTLECLVKETRAQAAVLKASTERSAPAQSKP
jgi:uncharacterized protein YecT (DUF1311 family)